MSLTPCDTSPEKLEEDASEVRVNLHDEFISVNGEDQENGMEPESMPIYVRVRGLLPSELLKNYHECFEAIDDTTVRYVTPAEHEKRNGQQAIQHFTFSHAFGQDVAQNAIFEMTMQESVQNFIEGQNCLIFAYGNSGSGKTYTMHGTLAEPGIIPLTVQLLFDCIKNKQVEKPSFKPVRSCDILKIDQSIYETDVGMKNSLLSLVEQDECDKTTFGTTFDKSSYNCVPDKSLLETSKLMKDACERKVILQGSMYYSVWCSFVEIYNEKIYDLLQPVMKKRPRLLLGTDSNGNTYVKDAKELLVESADEVLKLLAVARRNLRIASTKLNYQSSRSHCIFTIKLVRSSDQHNPTSVGINLLSFCDLAGSERHCKTQNVGDRLKEAGNINTSLMVLGKCLEALRFNQTQREKRVIVPFRESQLTRLFADFFCGKGRASMIVNISPSSYTFNETLNVLKFSALAKQVMQINDMSMANMNISTLQLLVNKWPRVSIKGGDMSNISIASIQDVTCEDFDTTDVHMKEIEERDEMITQLINLASSLEKQLEEEKLEKLEIEEKTKLRMKKAHQENMQNQLSALNKQLNRYKDLCHQASEQRWRQMCQDLKKVSAEDDGESDETDEGSDSEEDGEDQSPKKASTVGENRSPKKAATVGENQSPKKAATVGENQSPKKAATVGENRSPKKAATVGENYSGHEKVNSEAENVTAMDWATSDEKAKCEAAMNEKLEEMSSELKTALEEKVKSEETLNEKLKEMTSNLEKALEEKDKLEKSLNEKLKEMTSKLKKALEEKDKLEETANEKLKEMGCKLKEMECRLKNALEEKEKLEESDCEKLKEMKCKLEKAQEEKAELEERCEEMHRDMVRIQEEMEIYEGKLKVSKKKSIAEKEQNEIDVREMAEETYKELREQSVDMERALKEKDETLFEKTMEIDQLNNRLYSLNKELQDTLSKLRTVKIEMKEKEYNYLQETRALQDEVSDLSREKEMLGEIIKVKDRKLNNEKAKRSELEQKKKKLLDIITSHDKEYEPSDDNEEEEEPAPVDIGPLHKNWKINSGAGSSSQTYFFSSRKSDALSRSFVLPKRRQYSLPWKNKYKTHNRRQLNNIDQVVMMKLLSVSQYAEMTSFNRAKSLKGENEELKEELQQVSEHLQEYEEEESGKEASRNKKEVGVGTDISYSTVDVNLVGSAIRELIDVHGQSDAGDLLTGATRRSRGSELICLDMGFSSDGVSVDTSKLLTLIGKLKAVLLNRIYELQQSLHNKSIELSQMEKVSSGIKTENRALREELLGVSTTLSMTEENHRNQIAALKDEFALKIRAVTSHPVVVLDRAVIDNIRRMSVDVVKDNSVPKESSLLPGSLIRKEDRSCQTVTPSKEDLRRSSVNFNPVVLLDRANIDDVRELRQLSFHAQGKKSQTQETVQSSKESVRRKKKTRSPQEPPETSMEIPEEEEVIQKQVEPAEDDDSQDEVILLEEFAADADEDDDFVVPLKSRGRPPKAKVITTTKSKSSVIKEPKEISKSETFGKGETKGKPKKTAVVKAKSAVHEEPKELPEATEDKTTRSGRSLRPRRGAASAVAESKVPTRTASKRKIATKEPGAAAEQPSSPLDRMRNFVSGATSRIKAATASYLSPLRVPTAGSTATPEPTPLLNKRRKKVLYRPESEPVLDVSPPASAQTPSCDAKKTQSELIKQINARRPRR